MIKTIVFNLESIADQQKILRIQTTVLVRTSPVAEPVRPAAKRSYAEDLSKKLTGIKVRRVEKSPERSNKLPVKENQQTKSIHQSLTKSPARVQQIQKPQSESKSVVKVVPIKTYTSKPPVEKKSVVAVVQKEIDLASAICYACNRKFEDTAAVDAHMKSCKAVNISPKKWHCFCGESMDTSVMNKHMKECHDTKPEPLRCKPCKKVFLTQALFSQHELTFHKPKSPVWITCFICKQKLNSQADLNLHRITCKRKSNEA